MRTKIGLNGIVRNAPESTVKDGACEEVINMRYRDEAWRPVTAKKAFGIVSNSYERIWIHKGNDYTNYLGYKKGKIYWFNKDSGEVLQVINTENIIVSGAEFIGNTANFIGADKIHSALFYENEYHLFSNIKIPDINIKVGTGRHWYKKAHSDNIFAGIDLNKLDGGDVFEHKKFTGNLKGLYGKAMSEIEKTGYFEGHVIVRCVLEMYDGSPYYTYPMLYFQSPKDLKETIEIGATASNSGEVIEDMPPVYLHTNGGRVDMIVRYGNIVVEIPKLELTDAEKKIVKNISIYLSKPISAYDLEKTRTFNEHGVRRYSMSEIRNIEEVLFEKQTPLYEIEKIPIEDIEADYSKEILFDVKEITSFPVFVDDNSSMHEVSATTSFSTNNRVILGGVTTHLFQGYPAPFFSNEDSGSEYIATIKTYLAIGDEYSVVTERFGFSKAPIIINNVIGYPDSRATKMVVQVEEVSTGKFSYNTFLLKKSSYYNYSYYFNKKMVEVPSIAEGGRTTKVEKYLPISLGESFSNDSWTGDFYSQNRKQKNSNKIKVSELNNPLVYPAKNTYLAGKGEVVGLASNAVALSQGQFGQYPMFVFTTEGVWAMEQGDGEVVYKSVVPVNREVCNNSDSITQLDRAIAFTTDKGLMLLMGVDVKEISMSAEGEPSLLQDMNNTYEGAVNNAQLVLLKSNHSTINFKEYLKEAKIGYDYTHRELIVSNSNYPYSYIYGLDSNAWHKTTEQYKLFVNNYPKTLGVSDGKMVDVSLEDKSNTQVLLQTKAIKFESESYKAMRRIILRGLLKVSADKYAGLYIFGSYDSKKWAYLGGVQNKNEFRDMVAKTLRTDCKYFKIVFAGELTHDSYINYFELDVKGELQGRIR